MIKTQKSLKAPDFFTTFFTEKKIVKMNTYFSLRDYKSKKTGKQKIVLNFYQNKINRRFTLDVELQKKDWNEKKQRSKTDPDINLYLDNIEKKITEIKTQYRLNNKPLSLDKLVEEYQSGFSRYCFLNFYKKMLDETEREYSKGTYKRYNSVLNKMRKYKKEWLFSDIDIYFIDRFCNYLRKENQESTVQANLSAIRKFLNLAKRYEINMPLDLKDLKVKEIKHIPTTLDVWQLQKLWKYYFSEFIPKHHKLVAGYFLFSCFTGLRYSDVMQLKRQEGGIQYKIISQKTQKPITINLSQKAIDVVKEEQRLLVKPITEQHYNRVLKEIGAFLKIHKTLTTHVARHTFATNYIRMGGSETDLKNLLGHSSIRMTERYVSIAYDESLRNISIIDDVF